MRGRWRVQTTNINLNKGVARFMPSYSLTVILLQNEHTFIDLIDDHLLNLEGHNLCGTKSTINLTLYKDK